ncbi:hypothetical protein NBRC110019_05490 [Neptunitalea chrysea]|uniref:Uncharacterized protein n=1 Tax=Neptunitalea chrysea TaxID=1647581 RepID=A0A9W6B4K7_9FLAO|nr:hypothetical protein NBRC110019_05490 [Neptunitalea chrysea]
MAMKVFDRMEGILEKVLVFITLNVKFFIPLKNRDFIITSIFSTLKGVGL